MGGAEELETTWSQRLQTHPLKAGAKTGDCLGETEKLITKRKRTMEFAARETEWSC